MLSALIALRTYPAIIIKFFIKNRIYKIVRLSEGGRPGFGNSTYTSVIIVMLWLPFVRQVLPGRSRPALPADGSIRTACEPTTVVCVTRGLLEILCQMAADAEPESMSAGLAVTPAGELSDADDLADETPVFTHFYLPEAGRSIAAVFGMNLATPPGRTRGRFVSHPKGKLGVSRTDDLHGVVVVAIPPWDESSVAAFDRGGRRLELTVVDAVPPGESLESHSR